MSFVREFSIIFGMVALVIALFVVSIVFGIKSHQRRLEWLERFPEEIREKLEPKKRLGFLDVESLASFGFVAVLPLIPASRKIAWGEWASLLLCVLMAVYQGFWMLRTLEFRKQFVDVVPTEFLNFLRNETLARFVFVLLFLLLAAFWGWNLYLPRGN